MGKIINLIKRLWFKWKCWTNRKYQIKFIVWEGVWYKYNKEKDKWNIMKNDDKSKWFISKTFPL